MVQVLTGIKDEAAKLFMGIEQHPTTAVAIRSFANVVQNEKAIIIKKNPKDFKLYFLGNLDTETGIITGRQNPEIIATAEEFISEDK